MSRQRRCALVDGLESRRMLSATRLAVIGDFGADVSGYGGQELSVATMVKGWDNIYTPLDGVLTLGDNNYETGEWSAIDRNVGQYYAPYIGNYVGAYGPGAADNKFWPTPGNHDWASTVDHDGDGVKGLDPYVDYFTLPNNERYYDVVIGNVHVFAVDSDPAEPDGRGANSAQAQWIRSRMEASTSPWQVVIFHHPGYSSGTHGSDPTMRWPFAQWGADMVLAGHDHVYERLEVDGIPYVVNGVGGKALYNFGPALPETQYRYNADVGAQLVEATETTLTASFYNSGYYQPHQLLDQVTLDKNAPPPPPPSYSTATFQQDANGYAGAVDTQVQSYGPNNSFGAAAQLTIDQDEPPSSGHDSQGLVRFDDLFGDGAGQIPFGSEIVSARLDLNVTDAGSAVNLHRMLRGWSGGDTWNTLGAGIQTDNNEAAAPADASLTPAAIGTWSVDVSAGVRAWAANPDGNFGWALLSTGTDGVDFYASEGTVAPKLVVNYNPPTGPVVTVRAADAAASEAGLDGGAFEFVRSGDDLGSDLVVGYTFGGTTKAGTDYGSLSGIVTIAAGQASAVVEVVPIDDAAYEGDETVVVTLAQDAAYRVGSPGNATVVLADDELPPPVVTIAASDAAASETGDPGAYTVTRAGNLAGDLVVSYAVGGTATAGGDYERLAGMEPADLRGTVTIPAGEASVTFSVVPIDDTAFEAGETVIVTLEDGAAYDLGGAAAATVTIASDDANLVPPAAPSQLSGKAANGGRIDLAWKDNSNNETGFVLEWSRDGKTWTSIELAANTTTYSLTGLAKGTTYHFRARAVNAYGASAWTNVLKVRSAAK